MAEKVEIKDIGKYVNTIDDIGSKWMLVASSKDGKTNALTASWGGLGFLWRRPVAFIFIRPSRYTYDFIEKSGTFTLTFFDGQKEALGYLGKTSGRDVPDKIAKAGLHETEVSGSPTFEEGRFMISCRVIYRDPMDREKFVDKQIDEAERTAAGELIKFDTDLFTVSNTQGIHSRGCGYAECDTLYVLPQPTYELASRQDTINYQIPMLEDMIIDEMALEGAFEGYRFYDLMRVALRRGDPSYLASPIARRNGDLDNAIYTLLIDPKNWYLPQP